MDFLPIENIGNGYKSGLLGDTEEHIKTIQAYNSKVSWYLHGWKNKHCKQTPFYRETKNEILGA